MKALSIVVVLSVVAFKALRADLVPADPATPLFRIYEHERLPDVGPDPNTHRAKLGKLLLSVFTLRDLQFLPDDAARVTLNARDAEVFSQLTHAHDFMILVTGDEKGGVTMHISPHRGRCYPVYTR